MTQRTTLGSVEDMQAEREAQVRFARQDGRYEGFIVGMFFMAVVVTVCFLVFA